MSTSTYAARSQQPTQGDAGSCLTPESPVLSQGKQLSAPGGGKAMLTDSQMAGGACNLASHCVVWGPAACAKAQCTSCFSSVQGLSISGSHSGALLHGKQWLGSSIAPRPDSVPSSTPGPGAFSRTRFSAFCGTPEPAWYLGPSHWSTREAKRSSCRMQTVQEYSALLKPGSCSAPVSCPSEPAATALTFLALALAH